MNQKTSKKAFTLAETLITLVIIGVVASMTIPNIIATFQNMANISALKKNYSVISNAFNLADKFDGNCIEDWLHADGNQNALYENYTYIRKYLNVIRECNNVEGCWSSEETKAPDGSIASNANEKGIGGDIVTFTLMDGTNVCLDYWGKSDIISNFGINKYLMSSMLSIWVDVNGDRKPNKLGKDVFAFVLTTKGIIPAGAHNNAENCRSTGYDCAAKYLIDYK